MRGDGLRVRHHEQVLDRTEPQRVADLAVVRLRLVIPSGRYSEDAIAVQRIRLLMRDGTRRIAVSVRDEVSGVEASQAIMIGGEMGGAGS